MPILNFYFSAEYRDGSEVIPIGRKDRVVQLSVTGLIHDQRVQITNGSTATLWDAAQDTASFASLFILSDQDVMIEIQGTTAADNGNFKVRANVLQFLGTDDTLAYNAAGGFAGAAQDVKKVSAKNSSGSTATVRVFAVS